MDIPDLSHTGLTPGEVKLYTALVRYGAQSQGHLAGTANVSLSKIREIVKKLIKKGLAYSFYKNNAHYYASTDLLSLQKYVEKKEKEIQTEKKIIDEFFSKLHMSKAKEQNIYFELYEGWENIQNATLQAIKNTPVNSTVYSMGIQIPNKSFANSWHRERIKKKIKLRRISIEKPTLYKMNFDKYTSIRFISGIDKINIKVYPDRVQIIILEEQQPLTLILKYPIIVDAFLRIHSHLWEHAEE
jgi:sugar-specific transcriptional regulator TrmB